MVFVDAMEFYPRSNDVPEPILYIDRHPKQLHPLARVGDGRRCAEGVEISRPRKRKRFIYSVFSCRCRLHLHFMSFLWVSFRCERANRFWWMCLLRHASCDSEMNVRTHSHSSFSHDILSSARTDGRTQWMMTISGRFTYFFCEISDRFSFIVQHICTTISIWDVAWTRNSDYRFGSLLLLLLTPLFSKRCRKKSARIGMSHWHRGRVVVLGVTHLQHKKYTNCRQSCITFHSKKCCEFKFRFSVFFSFYRHLALRFGCRFPCLPFWGIYWFGSAFGCKIIEMKSFRFICNTHMISLLYSPSIIDIDIFICGLPAPFRCCFC